MGCFYPPKTVADPSPLARVASLELSSLGLEIDQLPSFDTASGALARVHTINLADNLIAGQLPDSWGGLRHLANLLLQLNILGGQLPTTIGQLTRLRFLDLDGGFTARQNRPVGCFDPCIVRSTDDTSLNTPAGCRVPCRLGNAFEGSLPSEMGLLTNLVQIDMHRNRFSSSIPTEIGNLIRLDWLELSGSYIQGPLPSEMGQMARLVKLYVDNNR